MTVRSNRNLSFIMGAALAALGFAGCDTTGTGGDHPVPGMPGVPGPGDPGDPGTTGTSVDPQGCNTAPACDESITVDPDGPALMVTDPAVLAEFPLDKVLGQIIEYEGIDWTPTEAMQRLFDTMNDVSTGQYDDVFHCDDPNNPSNFNKTGDTLTCPRAEGKLASATGFFTEGDPDSFFPVAVVNRFDLTPIDGSRCGQYRIIYAKRSGLDDPNNRVFVIFEAALSNPAPGCLEACRPVAQFWKGLEGKSTKEIATQLRTFYFAGIPGFKPAIHPQHFGFGTVDQGYGGTEPGQIRVSMHMQDSWDMREFHASQNDATGMPTFVPATVKNNPVATFFGPDPNDFGIGESYRSQFLWNEMQTLVAKDMKDVHMFTSPEYNGVESMLGGTKMNNYFEQATAAGDMTFVDALNAQIQSQGLNNGCPAEDPLDAQAVINRATALSCGGCHAPKEMIGADRSIGCGLAWPDSINNAHVSEKGERSQALKEVFLPHRADVMGWFLQNCDPNKIFGSLQNNGPGGIEDFAEGQSDGDVEHAVRTLGGSTSH